MLQKFLKEPHFMSNIFMIKFYYNRHKFHMHMKHTNSFYLFIYLPFQMEAIVVGMLEITGEWPRFFTHSIFIFMQEAIMITMGNIVSIC